jgi:glutamate dehydrogenase
MQSADRLDEHARLIAELEHSGELNRHLEFLPDEAEIEDRRSRKQGLTRPELAVVLSYAKINLYNGLIDSDASLEEFLQIDPQRYFPDVLRKRYADLIPHHRLSREILATLIANDIVNRMGPSFVKRLQADTGASILTVARAYEVARIICRARPLFKEIEALDHVIPAEAQMLMMFEISRRLRHTCIWLIEHYGEKLDIVGIVERLKEGMHRVYTRSSSYVSRASNARMQQEEERWIAMGAPEKLAHNVALLVLTRAALDIVDVAAERKRDVIESARLYAKFNDELELHWLHNSAEDLKVSGRWQAQARGHLRDEIYRLRRELALRLISTRGKSDPREVAERWLRKHAAAVLKYKKMLDEMKRREEIDFATLSVAAQELKRLISH